MKLDQLFKEKRCPFAIEVFPPKRTSAVESVYTALGEMCDAGADYISVTYSAGGTGASEYTAAIAQRVLETHGVEPLAHLTCVNARRGEIDAELARLSGVGVSNVLALRGDQRLGVEPSKDFLHASDLIATVGAHGGMYIVAACYPEGHPESASLAEDIDRLRFKLDAGAGHFVSQLFFDNGQFFRFLNLARKKGVDCPVEAGVMPVVRREQLERTLMLSSASMPSDFTRMLGRYRNDAAGFYEAGIDYAIRQIRDLIEGGADGIHLYAMNNPDVARRVYAGVRDLL